MNRAVIFFEKLTASKRKRINPARRLVIGFAALILVGTALLMLPAASRERIRTPFPTALFTSASATCVTGLVVAETGEYFSLFGQAVILALIQTGGLGFMTILTMAFIRMNKNINLRDRLMIAQTLSVDNLDSAVTVSKHVFFATAVFELAGAFIMSLRFVPRYGPLKGIWFGVFHSVSAFCNAGFDIFGTGDSVRAFSSDPLILLTLSALVITGGIGFLVWEDIYSGRFKRLTLYSRLALVVTAALLIFGTAAFYVFERKNPLTIGAMSEGDKWLNAFFQSVTCRTAGMDSIGQKGLTEQSKFISILLMMAGGASGSTAGGVKVSTVAAAALMMRASLLGSEEVVIWGRTVPRRDINNAALLIMLWIVFVTAAATVISVTDAKSLLDSAYEAASAYGTVGLTLGITENASLLTKSILIIYMFFGRVGILTISVMFITGRRGGANIKYPEGKLLIG